MDLFNFINIIIFTKLKYLPSLPLSSVCLPGDTIKTNQLSLVSPPSYRELSGLRAHDRQLSVTENFVHVQASWCVEGAYPQDLLHLWDLFHEEKGECEWAGLVSVQTDGNRESVWIL